MKCGFCGKEIHQLGSPRPDGKQDIVISQFLYDGCDHDPLPLPAGPDNLQGAKTLVDLQIRSMDRLEFYLTNKRETLTNQLKEFCDSNRSFLLTCEKISREFEQNFARLAKIKVDACCKEVIRENLEEYFDKDELVRWAKNCARESAKLLKKLESLEESLSRDLEAIFLKELVSVQQTVQPFKSKLNLQEITYKALEQDKEKRREGDLAGPRLESLNALYDVYKGLHRQAGDVIRQVADLVFRTTKKTDALAARNKYLVANNVAELMNDSKILAIFEDFDEVFDKCVEEIKLRSKFRYVYKKILRMLNEFTKVENNRRANFMLKFSSKIPSQIFPNIRKLSKEINIEKFFEGLDEELPLEESTCQKVGQSLEAIQTLLFGL